MTDERVDQPSGEFSVKYLDVDELRLDAENPRLSPELQRSKDQAALAINMAEIFDALEVAKSIARFGFYPWEAIVAIPDGDHYIVVEGNRRLTAVRGLLDPELRDQFESPEVWHATAAQASRSTPRRIPCVVVEDRRLATPALGYRHISGIKPWEPQMQARFVASLIDRDQRSYGEVAELTGQSKQWVQETYTTFKVFEQAESAGVDTAPVAEAYSLLTVAMSTPELRAHIGAERTVEEGGRPIANPSRPAMSEVFGWIFGNDETEPVAAESREIRALAKVISKPAGLEAIRAGSSLEEARQRVEDTEYDPMDVVRRDLLKAEQTLNRVDLSTIRVDGEISGLVDAIVEQAQRLLNQIDSESE